MLSFVFVLFLKNFSIALIQYFPRPSDVFLARFSFKLVQSLYLTVFREVLGFFGSLSYFALTGESFDYKKKLLSQWSLVSSNAGCLAKEKCNKLYIYALCYQQPGTIWK